MPVNAVVLHSEQDLGHELSSVVQKWCIPKMQEELHNRRYGLARLHSLLTQAMQPRQANRVVTMAPGHDCATPLCDHPNAAAE